MLRRRARLSGITDYRIFYEQGEGITVGYSGVDEENRSRKIFPGVCGTLLITSLIGCSLFSWFILQDPYKPLPEYPYAKNIQSQYTEDVSCCTETITTFETVYSPAEVYEFYRRAFRFRLKYLLLFPIVPTFKEAPLMRPAGRPTDSVLYHN